MKQRILTSVLVLVISTASVYAQKVKRKWYIIKDATDLYYSNGEKTKKKIVKNIYLGENNELSYDTDDHYEKKEIESLLLPKYKKADVFQKENELRVYFRPIPENGKLKLLEKSKIEEKNAGGYYFYELKERTSRTLDYRGFIMGAVTIPFKYYLGSKDNDNDAGNLSANFNIGTHLGWIFCGKEHFYYYAGQKKSVFSEQSINILFNTTLVPLNAENTEPDIDNNTNVIMPSFGLAYIYSFNGFEIIGSIGYDIPLGSNANTWIHKGYPWLGIGFGFGIF